jgi:YVTN family beta-propeller protein
MRRASLLFVLGAAAAGCGSSSSSGPSAPAATGRLYVTVESVPEVSVIDASNGSVTGHVPVDAGPAILIATPDGSKLYSANWKANTISAVDVATLRATPIAVDSRPYVISMSADGKTVYAGLNSNKIAVIDTATDTVSRSITMSQLPASVTVSPDGATLYVAFLDNTLEAIKASDGSTVHAPISVGLSPAWIALSPDGSKVYTLNFLGGTVSVIDTTSWQLLATVQVGSSAFPIVGAVSPDGSQLVVTDFGTGGATVIDTHSNQVVRTLKTDGRPVGVSFSADGKRTYVSDFGAASMSIPLDPTALLTGDLSTAAGPGPGQVDVFDSNTGAAVGTPIVTGAGPTSVVALAH